MNKIMVVFCFKYILNETQGFTKAYKEAYTKEHNEVLS